MLPRDLDKTCKMVHFVGVFPASQCSCSLLQSPGNISCFSLLQICFNWADFNDPNSGITSYVVGVGTQPNLTDVAPLMSVESIKHEYCAHLDSSLQHDHTYYVVVWANNGGINMRNISQVSNGGRFQNYIC